VFLGVVPGPGLGTAIRLSSRFGNAAFSLRAKSRLGKIQAPLFALPYPVAMETAQASRLFSAIVDAPFGAVGVRTAAGVLQELVYLPKDFEALAPSDAMAERAARQVERYLKEPDFRFDLPLAQVGTAFQQRVWSAIAAISRGQVLTYGQVAKQVRSAPRAVGQACGANWFPLVIPCHRVTATGGLGGFANQDDTAGFHLGVKRWLLAHEGVQSFR
jgi:methylated-DNA-[protein]-cysteine S-methyltransferase